MHVNMHAPRGKHELTCTDLVSGKHHSDSMCDHELLDAVLEDVLAGMHVHSRKRRVEHDDVVLRVACARQSDTLRTRTRVVPRVSSKLACALSEAEIEAERMYV